MQKSLAPSRKNTGRKPQSSTSQTIDRAEEIRQIKTRLPKFTRSQNKVSVDIPTPRRSPRNNLADHTDYTEIIAIEEENHEVIELLKDINYAESNKEEDGKLLD